MKQSKITIIQDYLKQYQPTINITKVNKKKDNFIVNCTINPTLSKISQDDNGHHYNDNNITEQKTYIIPIKDIQFPIKRKLPKVNKINLSI
jgi:hypothetical protein